MHANRGIFSRTLLDLSTFPEPVVSLHVEFSFLLGFGRLLIEFVPAFRRTRLLISSRNVKPSATSALLDSRDLARAHEFFDLVDGVDFAARSPTERTSGYLEGGPLIAIHDFESRQSRIVAKRLVDDVDFGLKIFGTKIKKVCFLLVVNGQQTLDVVETTHECGHLIFRRGVMFRLGVPVDNWVVQPSN